MKCKITVELSDVELSWSQINGIYEVKIGFEISEEVLSVLNAFMAYQHGMNFAMLRTLSKENEIKQQVVDLLNFVLNVEFINTL